MMIAEGIGINCVGNDYKYIDEAKQVKTTIKIIIRGFVRGNGLLQSFLLMSLN